MGKPEPSNRLLDLPGNVGIDDVDVGRSAEVLQRGVGLIGVLGVGWEGINFLGS